MATAHPLLHAEVVADIERAASQHLGRPWTTLGFSDRTGRAPHPCGILHGEPFSVFAKLGTGPAAREQFGAELAALRRLSQLAQVATPVPVADGLAGRPGRALLLSEALPECPPEERGPREWRSIGQALAALHQATGPRFGLGEELGFFGPLPQDNRPVPSDRWADFYTERRLIPMLRLAVDSGHLPSALAAGISRIAARLPELCGPEPRPTLLHGDAQQNNFLTTGTGAVLIDATPYFGHPEADLALVDYFQPVPADVLGAYRDVLDFDPGFASRKELWRLAAYLAVITVDGHNPFGRQYTGRLADAITAYS
ncbi:MAG: fructosamine kinase family protein [Streptosporangiaceae bacterium]